LIEFFQPVFPQDAEDRLAAKATERPVVQGERIVGTGFTAMKAATGSALRAGGRDLQF
jgi:hypothetical protein